MITPFTYFQRNPTACTSARVFCQNFPTMRKAWLSDCVEVGHMLWALGRSKVNKDGLLEFAQWCADRATLNAKRHHDPRIRKLAAGCKDAVASVKSAVANYDIYGVYYNTNYAAIDAARISGRTADLYKAARRRQREKLRKIFPHMFTTRHKGAS